MPNASELCRLEEEEIERLISTVEDLRNPKSVKEAALGKLRDIEGRTGRNLYRNYNRKSSR